jgi:hypothetical protein
MLKAVAMDVVAVIAFFWPNEPNPAMELYDPQPRNSLQNGRNTKRRPTPILASGVTLFRSFLTTEHHKAELGVLMPKQPAGAVLGFVFALKSCFCCRELLWFWQWFFFHNF